MSERRTVLTGIKPTGKLHLGNYVGALRPSVQMSAELGSDGFFFVADYHALTFMRDPKLLHELSMDIVAGWIALGLDPKKALLYRQSDIPEVFELSWILSCLTAKGLMNRAHAYKAAIQANREKGEEDIDAGVNLGLYNYPVLMAADILLFRPHSVPVGRDQQQHVEIAVDLAEKFNGTYGKLLRLPAPRIDDNTASIAGLDGRKMSKSYDNTIQLFDTPEATVKRIKKYVTDSSDPSTPKDPDTSNLFFLYREFATPDEVASMRARFQSGVGWGAVKEETAAVVNRTLAEPRKRFNELRQDSATLGKVLAEGAERARAVAKKTLDEVRHAVGIRPA